jgi:hypothetical protein
MSILWAYVFIDPDYAGVGSMQMRAPDAVLADVRKSMIAALDFL